MPDQSPDGAGPSERADAAAQGPRPTRGARARRIFGRVALVGFLILLLGFIIAFSAGGPSVPATIVLSVGLILAAVGLVAHRLVFWAEVMTKDRPAHGGRGPRQ